MLKVGTAMAYIIYIRHTVFFNTAGVIMHMLAFNLKSTVGRTV